jgi:hypothetical protein
VRKLLVGLGSLASGAWPSVALGCPYCAQDRGSAAMLIGALSLLPLLLAAAIGMYLKRIERSAEHGA